MLALANTPKMYSEIEKIDNVNRIYRRITIKNYVILYTIDEEKRVVYVAHMYYSGRNYLEISDD